MGSIIEKVSLYGWNNCYKLSVGDCEIVVTADVGPRIISFGKKGGENLLNIVEEQAGRSGDDEWLAYGGHRVWAAPEEEYLTYLPDNDAVLVEIDEKENTIRLTRSADESRLERSLQLRVATTGEFVIRNEILNRGEEPIRTASWGITAFVPGGIGILPLIRQPESGKQFQSDFSLNLWHYTDLSDPAYEWHKEAIVVHQDRCLSPQKIGYWLKAPLLGYLVNGSLIKKKTDVNTEESQNYPDRGSNTEVYFNPSFIELETLSPWRTLSQGESVWHEEYLSLIDVAGNESLPSLIELLLG